MSMSWVAEWAPRAVLYAGQAVRDRAREAIQLVSSDAVERTVYAHTGWRCLGGRWLYLHAGGALGADGPIEGVGAELPGDLTRYRLAEPPGVEAPRAAFAAVWQELPAVSPAVVPPLLGAVLTAPLSTPIDVDVVVALIGPTGSSKTSMVSALLNFYGQFPPTTTPVGFESTANYLEKLASIAKDLPLLVDDIRPPRAADEVAERRRKLERIIRGAGNRVGRGRMTGDTSLRTAYPPRALIILTGEDELEESSTIGRTLPVRVGPGTIDPRRLATWQHNPEPLRLVGAGFIRWLAGLLDRYGPEAIRALRDQASLPSLPPNIHPRLPQTLRHLLTGWALFARFAVEVGAVAEEAAARRLDEVARELVHHAAATGEAVRRARPSLRFIEGLRDLLASHRAYLDGRDGGSPPGAEALGWIKLADGTLVPRGERIGWADEAALYLIPGAARSQVARLLREGGERFVVSGRALLESLARDGYLLRLQSGRQDRTSVIKVGGVAHTVWALDRAAVDACLVRQRKEVLP